MAQVRETIELLVKVLRGNGTSKIKAESFRLAKFNNDTATETFWSLLFELLYFCKYGTIDEVAFKAKAELSIEELVVYVKQEMQRKGFLSREFASLPNDMSSGSREILLGFAWLLCKEGLIDKFMESCSSPLDEEDPSFMYEFEFEEMTKPSKQMQTQRVISPGQKVQHLRLLNGKLRSNIRQLQALQREKAKLQNRVHDSTYGVSLNPERNHLSVMEVHLLKHPELMKKILKLLEKDNERLQNMLSWKDQEEVFWKWMESVLDHKLKDKVEDMSPGRMTFYNIPPDAVIKMESAKQQLEDAIMKYEQIIEEIEEIWESKRSSISERELDNLLSSINTEISLQRANLALDSTEDILRNQKETRFLLTKNNSKKLSNLSSHISSHVTPQEQSVPAVDIEHELALMERQLERIELETNRKREKYRGQLENLASTVPEAICIQPMSCR
ncbi:tubulin epsilon and delta complex protein 1-like [Mytilus trossulus]|uniref:tubulin epsilon and delta complex protein 1-like n=1 Tax=Mytilus trossulus TaxID=6551 RepID=UPI003007001C